MSFIINSDVDADENGGLMDTSSTVALPEHVQYFESLSYEQKEELAKKWLSDVSSKQANTNSISVRMGNYSSVNWFKFPTVRRTVGFNVEVATEQQGGGFDYEKAWYNFRKRIDSNYME